MLKQRMKILKDGGVISDSTEQFMCHVIDMIDSLDNIDAQRAETFTTHMAMSLERIAKGNIVTAMDRDTYQDVRQCPEFESAQNFYDSFAEELPLPIPESEKEFLLLHICNLMQP